MYFKLCLIPLHSLIRAVLSTHQIHRRQLYFVLICFSALSWSLQRCRVQEGRLNFRKTGVQLFDKKLSFNFQREVEFQFFLRKMKANLSRLSLLICTLQTHRSMLPYSNLQPHRNQIRSHPTLKTPFCHYGYVKHRHTCSTR